MDDATQMNDATDPAGDPDGAVQGARAALAAASRIVVFTGAGVSAESGIPTFRDAQTGLWARYDPARLASEAGFRADPQLVWDWYAHRRARVEAARPNPAHEAIARLQRLRPGTQVVTQNVDGLHQRAGSPDVIELHGSILRVRCLEGHGEPAGWRDDARRPPRCPACDAPLRPDVVWFGEWLPQAAWARAQQAADACDAMLVVGTSALVQPAAELPLRARAAGAALIVVDPSPTPLDAVAAFALRAPAGALVPQLVPQEDH